LKDDMVAMWNDISIEQNEMGTAIDVREAVDEK
jgi:uroporphyrinogen-III decarboxylase